MSENQGRPAFQSQPSFQAPYEQGYPEQQGYPYGTPPATPPTAVPPSGGEPSGGEPQPERRPRRGPARLVALVLAAALLGGGVGGLATATALRGETPTTAGTTTPIIQSNGGGETDWAAVAEAVSPAVVSITVQSGSGTAAGSGVILDAQGHIATNNHVISGGDSGTIYVTLNDNTVHEAKITGTDPDTDLAVITLTDVPDGLTPIAFADVSTLAVGDPVMAIGNPLGLSGSVTTGIVSALHRPVQSESSGQDQQQSSPWMPGGNTTSADTQVVTDAIQTSDAINPGNSGGALVNSQGQLIGLTSSIATLGSSSSSSESGNIGIGFAIPADQVKAVSEELIKTGTAATPFLGVSTTDGMGTVDGQQVVGAQVRSVESGSPAQQAGIQEGDVITSVDDVPITGSVSLAGRIRSQQVGAELTLEVSRDGRTSKVQVTLASK